MHAMTVAVDLAKDVFEVAVANRAGRITERKRLTRRQFEPWIDALPAGTTVVMEACTMAHYWGRRCVAHESMLMTPCGPARKPVLLIHQVPSGWT